MSIQLPSPELQTSCTQRCLDTIICCNRGQVTVQQPPQPDSQPKPSCCSRIMCLFTCCISNRVRSRRSSIDERPAITFDLVWKTLEERYGRPAAEAAFSEKRFPLNFADLGISRNRISEEDFAFLDRFAQQLSRHWVELSLKGTQFITDWERHSDAGSDSGAGVADSIIEVPKPKRHDSIPDFLVRSESGEQAPFSREVMVEKIKQKEMLLEEPKIPTMAFEEAIHVVVGLVIDDLVQESQREHRLIFTSEELRSKVIQILKRLGFLIKRPEYFERVAPIALRILNKGVDNLTPEEYKAFLELAPSFIASRHTSREESPKREQPPVRASINTPQSQMALASALAALKQSDQVVVSNEDQKPDQEHNEGDDKTL